MSENIPPQPKDVGRKYRSRRSIAVLSNATNTRRSIGEEKERLKEYRGKRRSLQVGCKLIIINRF